MTFESFWKGEPWSEEKRRKKREQIAARKKCREEVIARDKGRCQRCGRRVSDDLPEWHPARAHVNETVPRSRGGDPTNPDHCELLCQGCHMPNGQHAPTKERMEALRKRRRREEL